MKKQCKDRFKNTTFTSPQPHMCIPSSQWYQKWSYPWSYRPERLSCLFPIPKNLPKTIPILSGVLVIFSSGLLFAFSPPLLHVQNCTSENVDEKCDVSLFPTKQKKWYAALSRQCRLKIFSLLEIFFYSKYFLYNERISIARSFQ